MAQFNENITLAAPNPLDKRYLSSRTLAGSQLPYSSCTEVTTTISTAVRYTGLTVLIKSGTTSPAEYWFRCGVANGNLIPKTIDVDIPQGDFITGATNLGYFSGTTGLQSLCISPYSTFNPLNYTCYIGDYQSLYNYYYRDCDGIIRIGEPPSDYIPKRGYVHNPTILNPNYKSWIWNEYTGSSNCIGWILIDGNITNQLGTFQYGCTYYTGGTSQPFINTSWSGPGSCGTVNVIAVEGSLSTGNTLIIGARSFACAEHNNLHFRTIISETPNLVKVWDDDDTLIHLSGASAVLSAANAGATGENIFLGQTGTTLYFKRIRGSGATTVSTSGGTIIVSSTLTGGTGGGTYNLSSPSSICVGGILSGTTLTGKTAFQLFEELLVPALYPVLTAPSNSISINPSGTFEVGCSISTLCITSNFNQGCINPQYTATCSKRSNGAESHCFIGCQVTGCYVCSANAVTKCATSYVMCLGAQTWETHVHYSGGTQPKDSKGCNYSTPLVANETSACCTTLTGIYPYYYGKLTCGIRPPVTNALVTVGCLGKVVADSTGTITVTFGSSSSEYTWLAIPSTSTSKTCWYVNALDNGCINSAPSDKYPDECLIAITSAESCWAGVNYKVYMSGTVGAISAPIQFRNS